MTGEQLAALIGTVLIVAYLMWALAEYVETKGGTRGCRRVYLAGRFSRRNEFNGYAARLREWGYTVDAQWLTEDHEWYGEDDDEALAAAARFAMDDLTDVARADIVLVFTEPPNPGGRNRGGRHVEYGLALGLSKDIIVVGRPENVFHNLEGGIAVPTDELHRPLTRVAHARWWEEVPRRLAEWGYPAGEPGRNRCLAHLEDEPCPTCASYIAAGL